MAPLIFYILYKEGRILLCCRRSEISPVRTSSVDAGIPTFDTLIQTNSNLRAMTATVFSAEVTYNFSSDGGGDNETSTYDGLNVAAARALIENIRKLYQQNANKGNFQYNVQVTFKNNDLEIPYTWTNG